VQACFDGGSLSSDAGLLVLREVEGRLGVAERLARCLEDPRNPALITHALADMIRFRMMMNAAGYEDGNDAASLRQDPVFKMAQGMAPSSHDLASQPTISRLENMADVRALLRMGAALVNLFCASFKEVPKRIVLDIDDTFDTVHGGQQHRRFNGHYVKYGFQPIVVFDGEDGACGGHAERSSVWWPAEGAPSQQYCARRDGRRASRSAATCAASCGPSAAIGPASASWCAPTATMVSRR